MNIIPQPNKVVLIQGKKICLGKNTIIICQEARIKKLVENLLVASQNTSKNTIEFVNDSAMAKEEYFILAQNGTIVIKGSCYNGYFYAVQTLMQMMDEKWEIECAEICDKPRFSYRGFMLDCARHFWTIEKIKQYLDLMSNFKMNIFHWHLSEDQGWRVEIKKYPLLTEKGSIRKDTPISLLNYYKNKEEHDTKEYGKGMFYTQKQLRDVVNYAKERCIEIIPEIDMPGHLVSAIACYPELSCRGEKVEVSNRWGVMDNIACCGKENIYTFAKDILDELTEIFPCKYFHIGGDEVPKTRWEVCPNCQAKIKELKLANENALQGHFNNILAEYLVSKGKSMLGWSDILDSGDTLDKNIIAQWWRKHLGNKNEMAWIASGGKVLLSYDKFVYMDHPYMKRPLALTYSLTPKKLGITNDNCVIGVEAPQWTEYIRDERKLDFNTIPRLCAIAEVGWTEECNKDYSRFESNFEAKRKQMEKVGRILPSQKIYRGNACFNPFKIRDIGMAKWAINPYFELEKDGK